MGILAKLHVIAIAKELNNSNDLEVYVYSEGKIYAYSPELELEVSWPYSQKIREIARLVDTGRFDWVDIVIEDGQDIRRESNRFYLDGGEIMPFRRLSDDFFSNVGPITSKIYNEFIKSRNKDEKYLRELLDESFFKGVFSTQVANIVEFNFQHPIEWDELNNLDKQIIVRTKIEGYQFIIEFIKNILHSNAPEKNEYCEIFLSRIFLLESQNYIKL